MNDREHNRYIQEQASALVRCNAPEPCDTIQDVEEEPKLSTEPMFVPSPRSHAILNFCQAIMMQATGCPHLDGVLNMEIISKPTVETIDVSDAFCERAVNMHLKTEIHVEMTFCQTPELVQNLMEAACENAHRFYYVGGVVAHFAPNQLVTVTLGVVLSEPQRRDLVGLMTMEV